MRPTPATVTPIYFLPWIGIAESIAFRDFNILVIGHGLDPMTVHREFLKIDEYRCWIPPDHR